VAKSGAEVRCPAGATFLEPAAGVWGLLVRRSWSSRWELAEHHMDFLRVEMHIRCA